MPSKVLIVEDSRSINSLLVSKINEELHIDVESASSYKEAKAILQERSREFFVAILDLNLPDAPKGEIVDYVLSKGIPPIVLTGNMSESLHDEMIEKDIIDYVVKLNLNEIDYVVSSVKRLRENVGRKVLVVDDSKSSRKFLSALLKRHYLTVLEASDGYEALELLKTHNNVVLMVVDYNMPGMNGMEVVSKVREKHSRHQLAILGVSGIGSGKIPIKLLKSGANDFISRPFMIEEFYCRVNQNIDAIDSYTKLQDSADKDFLTGIYNRKGLFSAGEKIFQNAKRKNITMMAAMIDVDHFKSINDTYGHDMGDKVLQHIAKVLKQNLREADIVARIGGEEFCLICVNIDAENSEKVLENHRTQIMNDPLFLDGQPINVTVSIGYSISLSSSLENMLIDTDFALYKAKKTGRNKVICFREEKQNDN